MELTELAKANGFSSVTEAITIARKARAVKPNDEVVPVSGIRLRKDGEGGKYTVVDAEIGGTWVEVIRELSDGEFCHIVEPSGMYSRYYAMSIS